MLMHRIALGFIVFAGMCFKLQNACCADFTFLGPTPYLSAADSPYPVDGSNPNFYLEDFEDGELNTPGIHQPLHPVFGTAFHGTVMGPGEFTDSVDGDDGAIDGFGKDGHSLRSSAVFIIDTLPPLLSFEMSFDFDQSVLGQYPTAFGVVWTDGPQFSRFSLRITTGLGNVLNTPSATSIGDTARDGSTAEDFFVGVIHSDGIANVTLKGGYIGSLPTLDNIEIDHLQYGTLVPEPNPLCSVGVLIVFLFGHWRANSQPANHLGRTFAKLTSAFRPTKKIKKFSGANSKTQNQTSCAK